jgi:hypothetical protein
MQTHSSRTRPPDSSASSSAEKSLLDCILEQGAVFNAAVVLLEKLETDANRRHLGDPDSVAQLQKTLERVVTAQQNAAKAYEKFSASKVGPSSTVRNSLARHEETLKRLVARIDSLQHIFETLRNDMSPELDTDVRRRSMHSAYQKSLKTV